MTRWHPDDLAGKLLKQMESGGERWDVVSLSAIAEKEDLLGRTPGEALWPERFDEEKLAEMKEVVSPYWWSAQYQQRQIPREGTLFQRDWFDEPITDYPPDATLVRYWDPAATKDGTIRPVRSWARRMVFTTSWICSECEPGQPA